MIDRQSDCAVHNAALAQRMHALKPHLDRLYGTWNRAEFVSPDPLEAVRVFDDPGDCEVAGLIASSLAFGNVKQILASIDLVLTTMKRPAAWLDRATERTIRSAFEGFRHRYSTGTELSDMLVGAKLLRERFGSLGVAFAACMPVDDDDISNGLESFVALLRSDGRENYLLPNPARGSACKRLHLYLRWMVRSDAVDLGCWGGVAASKLLVPVDTHMHRIAMRLGLTARNAADLRTSREITAAFRVIAPEDPVRYDFALTRLGIRKDTNAEPFLAECSGHLLR
ncbi:MAG: TIGR02757 family protein [Candidatus Hydrogenedentes bacterium]|nr:TIGR02757 family protein [Candidatus Hydrogenedentota bacterium]